MFIFTQSIKDLVVTAGVAISCGLFVAEAIRGMYRGIWGLVFGLFLLLLVAAVIRGKKLGYLVTRYIWRAAGFCSLVGAVLNPFAWEDAYIEGFALIGLSSLLLLVAIWLSYSLSEHAKLRKLKGAQTWRGFP